LAQSPCILRVSQISARRRAFPASCIAHMVLEQDYRGIYDWVSGFVSAPLCEGALNPIPWQVIVVTADDSSFISNFASVICSATQIAVLRMHSVRIYKQP